MADVEMQKAGGEEEDNESSVKTFNAEADEVEEYAASAMDEIFGSVNDAFGAQISSAFDGGGDDEGGPDVDVLTLLFVLIISKIGISFSVGIDWNTFASAFGWLNHLSVLAPRVPNVGQNVIKTVTFVLLLLIQPVCLGRMNWLSREHRGDAAPPLPNLFNWLPRIVRTKLIPFNSMFTPSTIILWLLFWIIFIAALATNSHMLAGFIFIFFGIPAIYLTFINFSRQKTWEYVYLRYADVVRLRQYENLCLKEGSFVLFIFVASYTFVMNFFISLLSTWDTQSGTQNAFLVIGFILYGVLPLWYLHHIITDVNADRTFRIFREQLVSPFVDQHMYMKLVLLVESVLFSLLVLLGKSDTSQLVGGFVVSVVFFFVATVSRPYEDDMENYSDIIARLTVCLTTMLGLIILGSGSGVGIDVCLILISCGTTLWFLYTIDIKEILLARFFMLLQLYAQAKASHYTKNAIRKLPDNKVRRVADSPIEFHVLSAMQRIHFATLRKEAFFGGKRIKELADLGVTWLDLQQLDFTCASLRELGFTADEMMAVDAQLDDMGDRSDIQKLYEDVYAERKDTLGENDRSTLLALHTLGVLYKDMGEHLLGMDTLQRCYKARCKVFGEDDEDTLVSMQYVGEYYVFLSRASDGLELLQKCYDLHQKAGEDSEATLDCMRALGKCMQGAGLSGEALKILEKRYVTIVAQTMANKMRRDHPSTLPCRLDYANALADCGCYTSIPALKLHSIMNRQKTIHGADHPDTLKLMDQYGELLSKMGNHNGALALHLECVSEKAATLGPNHTGTIASKFALAATYLELGRNMEMEKLNLEASLSDQDTRLGETHPSTISSMVKLGALYNTMTRYKEALDLFRTCYDVRVKSLGKDHEMTLGVANNIAAVLDSMDKYAEAQDMYEQSLTILEERFGKTHLNTTAVLLNLGLCYQRRGNLSKARAFYKDTLEICTEAYGEKHPRTLMAYDFLGCLCLIEEKFAEAKDIFEKGMELRKDNYDESHPLCMATMENLASAMQRLGQKQESLEIYRKIVHLKEINFGPKHIDAVKARAGMSIVNAELGNVQEALTTMIACVHDGTAILGPAAPQIQEYLGVVGYIYAICGHWDDGIRYTNMSLTGTIKIYGEHHFLVKQLLTRKAWMLTSAGRTQEAAQVTSIINSMDADGGATAIAAAPSAATSTATGAGTTSTTNPTAATETEVLSPLQKQLQAEAAADKNAEAEIVAKLQSIIQLLSTGQIPTAVPLIQNFLENDVERIKEPQTILLSINTAAYALNAQQFPLALQIMLRVYPCIELNFSTINEILLPAMDLLGKCLAYSGNVPQAIPVLEKYMELSQTEAEKNPNQPLNETYLQTQELMIKLYGSIQQFDKAIDIYTSQYDYYTSKQGETSESAISALNNRAMYYFALKNFEKSRADHKEVYRLLVALQGADHPDSVRSIEGFRTLYTSNGLSYD